MMPFFSAAFATSQPVDARVRWISVAAVALGALVVAVGYAGGNLGLGAVGGAAFMTGIALTAYATIVPVRRPLARRGGVVTLGYAAALLLGGQRCAPGHALPGRGHAGAAGLGQPATCPRLAQPRGLRLARHRHDAAALLPHRHRGAHPARPERLPHRAGDRRGHRPGGPRLRDPLGLADAGWRPGRPGRGPRPGRLRCADLAHQVGLDGRRGLASLRHGRPALGHRLVRGRGPDGHGPTSGRGCRPRGRRRHRLPGSAGPGLGRAGRAGLRDPPGARPSAQAILPLTRGSASCWAAWPWSACWPPNARRRRPGPGPAHGQRRAPGGRHGADEPEPRHDRCARSWLRSPPGCAALARAATWWPEAPLPAGAGDLSAPEARR